MQEDFPQRDRGKRQRQRTGSENPALDCVDQLGEMAVTVVEVRGGTGDANRRLCEQFSRIAHRARERSAQEQCKASITVMGKAARETLRRVVGHRSCGSRVEVRSTAALSRERTLRAAANTPARCRNRDTGG